MNKQAKYFSPCLLLSCWPPGGIHWFPVCDGKPVMFSDKNRFMFNPGSVLGRFRVIIHNHHHHKHQGLDPLIHSVSRVTAARANASSFVQLFSFLVVCSGIISKGFCFVAFFGSVEASSVCIHLSCLVCL